MTLNANGPAPLMQAGGVASSAFGQYTGDGSGAVTIPLGFTPIYVKVFDETDSLIWEWNAGLAATHTFKTALSGPAITLDTGSAIVSNHNIQSVTTSGVYAPGSAGPGDGTLINTTVEIDSPNLALPQLVLSTSLNTTSSLYSWVALG